MSDHPCLPSARILLGSFCQNPPSPPMCPLGTFPFIDSPTLLFGCKFSLSLLYSELSPICLPHYTTPLQWSLHLLWWYPHLRLYLSFFSLAMLGLHCCTWSFSSCSEWGLLSSCSARVSHCSGFSCCIWALGAQASVAVAHGLNSMGFSQTRDCTESPAKDS